jgi:hypothetical protein
MRVAFVSQPRDPVFASGVQRGSVAIVTWELARHLAESHLVQVYAPQYPGEPREERAANGVTIRRVRSIRFSIAVDLQHTERAARPPPPAHVSARNSDFTRSVVKWMNLLVPPIFFDAVRALRRGK